MPNRKRKIKLIHVIIMAAILIIAYAALGTMKNAIVISNGIVFYRSIRTGVLTVLGLLTVLVVFLFLWDAVKQAQWQKSYNREQAQSRAAEAEKIQQEQQEKETLSVAKNMDSVKLREILDEYSAGDWKNIAGEMRQIHIQMDMMDEQQEKLARLLQNNGAAALSNTEDILDKVEQHMCRSVRKVINYMDVANASRPEDVDKVLEKIYACHADNQTQLQQVQEFLFALADFLNTQGDDDNSAQMLDLYKNTILNSIQD